MISPQQKKDIKIKTNVVKRLVKELAAYQKEYITQQNRIQKYINDNRDDHDIRKQREVLEETNVMIPDCKSRLTDAIRVLEDLVAQNKAVDEEEVRAAIDIHVE
jgi:tubulin-specific chaperone A